MQIQLQTQTSFGNVGRLAAIKAAAAKNPKVQTANALAQAGKHSLKKPDDKFVEDLSLPPNRRALNLSSMYIARKARRTGREATASVLNSMGRPASAPFIFRQWG